LPILSMQGVVRERLMWIRQGCRCQLGKMSSFLCGLPVQSAAQDGFSAWLACHRRQSEFFTARRAVVKRLVALSVVSALCMVTVGCAGVSRPSWLSPGNTEVQQARAEQYDPYPETDVGPVITGGRPRSYEKPPAEVQRVQPPIYSSQARWLPWNWGS